MKILKNKECKTQNYTDNIYQLSAFHHLLITFLSSIHLPPIYSSFVSTAVIKHSGQKQHRRGKGLFKLIGYSPPLWGVRTSKNV